MQPDDSTRSSETIEQHWARVLAELNRDLAASGFIVTQMEDDPTAPMEATFVPRPSTRDQASDSVPPTD